MGTQLPLTEKGGTPPIFGPCLLCPMAWIYHDATWYRGSPRPKRHCVRWRPSSPSPERGQGPSPNFRPMSVVVGRLHGSRWHLVMPRPRPHFARWGPSSPFPKRGHTPNFRPMSIVAKRSPISATVELLLSSIQQMSAKRHENR